MDEKNPLGNGPVDQPTPAPVPPAPAQPAQPAAAPQPVLAPAPQPAAPQGAPVVPATAPLPPQGAPVVPPAPVQPTPAPTQPQANPYAAPQAGPAVPPQNPYGANPYGQPQPPMNPRADGAPSATGAIVCGVLAILFSWIPLAGLILGIVALVLASKFVKLHGKGFGGSGAAKVCGIVGIVFSVLWGIFTAIAMVGVIGIMNDEGFVDEVDRIVEEAGTNTEESSSEAADIIAVQGILDQLEFSTQNPSQETMAEIASQADADFKDIFSYSMTELTIDPMSAVNWLKEDIAFDYDPDSDIIVFSDGTATAFVSVTMHDSQVMADNFDAEINAMIDANPFVSSDAEKNALIADAFNKALAASTDTRSYSVMVELTKNGNTWEVDQESWQEELDYLYRFM